MQLRFSSREDKDSMQAALSGDIGSFLSASVKINTTASKLNISGSININAYQLGGDPTQLSKVISTSSVECDFRNNIDACKATAQKIIDYASENFPHQFQRDGQGMWTGPLVPLSDLVLDYKVSDFGIKLAPSYVTEELILARKEVDDLFERNEYYARNLLMAYTKYPYQMTGEVIQFQKKFQLNSVVLSEGLDLYNFPATGVETKVEILKRADKELEKNYLDNLHPIMESIVRFKFTFKDSICYPKWQRAFDSENVLIPIGPNTAVVNYSIGDPGNFKLYIEPVSVDGFTHHTYKMDNRKKSRLL